MENTKISVQDLNLHYGTNHALKHVNMEIRENAITAFIGPSGCGKSTFLKCLNRMNDLVENQGKAILMISSEMEELMGMSDRIIVLSEGNMTGELNKDEFSQETIMAHASAASVEEG